LEGGVGFLAWVYTYLSFAIYRQESLASGGPDFKKLSTQSAQVNKTVTERLFFGGTADDYKKLTNRDISQPADLGQDDNEDAVCDYSPDGVRPAAGGEQCPETDDGIDSSNQSNKE